jgi:hypothetical protein
VRVEHAAQKAAQSVRVGVVVVAVRCAAALVSVIVLVVMPRAHGHLLRKRTARRA